MNTRDTNMEEVNLGEALRVMQETARKGVAFFLEEGKLKFRVPKNVSLEPGLISEIQRCKDGIRRLLAEKEAGQAAPLPPIRPREGALRERAPLSFAQERLWFIDQMEGSAQYHIPTVMRIGGGLNALALEQALRAVIARHEVLRSVIEKENGQPWQRALPAEGWSAIRNEGLLDVSAPGALEHRLGEIINRPFDLSKDYLLRAGLLKLSADEHILVLVLHHIVADGWSMPVLIGELTELYRGYSQGAEVRLRPLPIQYADFAVWQREYLQGEVLEKKLGYWQEQLKDVQPLDLPTDFPRPHLHTTHGAGVPFAIRQPLAGQVMRVGEERGATLFMVLLAAFKVLLYKYSGQEDICVGTPTAGRQHKELEGLIGFFVNMLAFRTVVRGDDTFTDLLASVKDTTLSGYDHQEVPFEKIVEAVVKQRDMSTTPLFRVVFALQNNEQAQVAEGSVGEMDLRPEDFEQVTSKFDINVLVEERFGELLFYIEYNTDLYRRETIDRLFAHYEQLLHSIVAAPHATLNELDLLPSDERNQVEQLFPAQSIQHSLDNRFIAAIPSLAADSRLFILDNNSQPCPIGIYGDVYVQTEGDTTRIPTDVIARWNEKGQIDYQGLRNDQVVVHGHRLYRSHIAELLEQSGLAAQALVTLHPEAGLVAYIVPAEEGGFYRDGLISFLRSRVPEYAIPSVWIALEEVPLTRNGSIDYTALPDVEEGVQKQAFVAPSTELEIQVAAIWKELLQVERRLSIHDNFFEMGGGSLLSMRLIAALRNALGVEVSVKEMFYYNTIAKLCEHLKQLEGTTNASKLPVLKKEERPARIPLSFAQERLWFIDQLEGSVQYHIPFVLRLQGELDQQALSFALKSIIDRHEVLRTVIDKEEGIGYQRIVSSDDWQLSYTQWQSAPEALRTYIEKQIATPFALAHDYLIRAELIKVEKEHVLILVLHHLVSDGWSLPILVNELTELYRSYKEQRTVLLPELPIQYADYAIWQRRYLQGEVLDKKLGYWKEQLKNAQPLNLPTDHTRPPVHTTYGDALPGHLPLELMEGLERLSRQHDTTLFMTMLTAFKVLLHKYSGQEDICVGTPIAGRQYKELDGLIGFFVNTLALRSDLNAERSFADLLKNVRATVLDAFEHQEVPFEQVVEAVVTERDLSRTPVFQVMFVMQTNEAATVNEGGLGQLALLPEAVHSRRSIFELDLSIWPTPQGLQLLCEYNTDLYERETISRLFAHYEQLLRSIVAAPHATLKELDLLPSEERNQVEQLFPAQALQHTLDGRLLGALPSLTADSCLLILDAHQQPCPIGIDGEVYVQTGIDNALVPTGAIARWDEKGGIDYQGLHADQVVVHGHRLFRSDIVALLEQSGLATQALITLHPEAGLIAYIVPGEEGGFYRDGLISFLRTRVPEYAIPSVWIALEEVPLARNGSIDYTALPDVEEGVQKQAFVAPSTELEIQVAAIWKELLQVERRLSIHDNFFEMGGGSLLSMRLIAALRTALGVEVSVKEMFYYNTIAKLCEHLKQLEGTTNAADLPVLKKEERPARIPLSFAQERLWFIDQLEGSVQYHIPFVLRLQGELDQHALSFALKSIIDRHEVLRTVIDKEEGVGYQRILSSEDWQLSYTQWQSAPEALRTYIEKQIALPFTLSQDYPIRAELIRIEEEHVLILVLHHLVSDGWSLPILVNELTELYRSHKEQRTALLPELPIQYADYAIWQRRYLQGEVLDKKLSYWKEQLADVQPLNLPTDKPRPSGFTTNGGAVTYWLDRRMQEGLERLSRQHNTTLFMTMLAAFKVLLYKYSGQEDICVGTPIAGRQYKELEGLIGLFLNSLALRSRVSGNVDFTDLLNSVRTTMLDAFEHQEVPFEQVVEAVVTDRDLSRTPVFQVMFVMQDNAKATVNESAFGELTLVPGDLTARTSIFELNLSVWPSDGQGMLLNLEYSTDLYEEETVLRLLHHYEALLNSILQDPRQQVDQLTLLGTEERRQVLHDFNETHHLIEYSGRLGDLLDEAAKEYAAETAVVFNETSLTYAELDRRGNQLAHYLLKQGIPKQGVIGVCLERSPDLIIALVAIAKAGAGYVPLDPSYPAERLAYMAFDSGVDLVISHSHIQAALSQPLPEDVRILDLDRVGAELETYSTVTIERGPLAGALGYLLYTSGSTGRPKGVEFPESGLLNLLLWHQHKYGSANKKVLQFASIGFDASFQEIYSALCFGGTICLVEEDQRKDMGYLLNTIEQNQITDLFLPYVVLRGLAEEARVQDRYPQSLSYIFTAGEQLRLHEDIGSLQKNTGLRLLNYYGPSETHVVTAYEVQEEDYTYTELPPIGAPIWNTTVYILDSGGAPVPIGVPGEIYLGGVQIANGYRNQPTLTQERFIDKLIDGILHRLYRTGDIGQWRADGQVLFLGRRDEQVKIRGNRVELAEVEVVVEASGLVEQSVVIAPVDGRGYRNLICYVVPNDSYDRTELQTFLRSQVPDYMVPAAIIELDALPVTTHGKVDKRALPAAGTMTATTTYEAPNTNTEKQLTNIWQSLLNVERVGRNDSFFELGGHSLLATRLVSALRKELNVEVPIKAIFVNPRLQALAQYIEQLSGEDLQTFAKITRPAHLPLSFAQERLWFIDQLEGSTQYHIPFVLRLQGQLDEQALSFALKSLIARHEVLRTVIRKEEDYTYQHILDTAAWTLRQHRSDTDDDALQDHIEETILEPFQLSRDYPLRAELISLQNEYVLILVLHHIVADGWSLPILVNELTELYNSYKQRRTPQLPDLPIQYADYALWQRHYLQGAVLDQKLAYWKQKLDGVEPLNLPTDHPRPPVHTTRGATTSIRLDKDLAASLHTLSRQHGATLFMTLLAAYKVLLYKYSGQEDICVGTPIAGRQHREVEGLIGFFINSLALRTRLAGNEAFDTLLADVRTTVLDAFEHQELPFEKVVEAVVKERDMSRTPLFQVSFVLQNYEPAGNRPPQLDGLMLTPRNAGPANAKHDLTLFIREEENGEILVAGEYNTDLYAPATIERLLRHYEHLLRSIAASPATSIDRLSLLTPEEEDRLLLDFNRTARDYDLDQTTAQRFESQAARTPNATAVVFEDGSITYAELDGRSNTLADRLDAAGVEEGSRVPLIMYRGIDFVVAFLAVMKTGAVAVPLSIYWPADRLQLLLNDLQPSAVLTNAPDLTLAPGTPVEVVDHQSLELTATHTRKKTSGSDTLCIFYTSGSTGMPKGVVVPHAGILNRLLWMNENFGVEAARSVLRTTKHIFDSALWQIFWPLINGGTTVIPSEKRSFDLRYFLELVEDHRITMTDFVPSLFNQLVEELDGADEQPSLQSLRHIIIGGEAIGNEAVQSFRARYGHITLTNLYGPTEASIGCVSYTIGSGGHASIPIGKPIANAKVLLLDAQGAPVPIGVGGELHISGVCLAQGYWNDPEKTQKSFLPNPYRDRLDRPDSTVDRLYKTGDRARWLPDGNIEYLGRADDQVKVRGYRIEPGEVEAVLLRSGFVTRALVLAKKNPSGLLQLVAYVVPADAYDRDSLLGFLRSQLPDYMVPSILVPVESLQLTAGGKIDRKALPDPFAYSQEEAYVEPRTGTERLIATVWQDVLKLVRVGIRDNFFALGGHSLAMALVINRLVRAGLAPELKDLFAFQTVERLAAELSGRAVPAQGTAETEEGHLHFFGGARSGQPLFIVPGSDGICNGYSDLAAELRSEGPVYGIQMYGFYIGEQPLGSVEEIAALNIEWIKKVQPQGPYRLVGHSFGGVVAFEMAKQLEAAGATVELLAVLDITPAFKRKNTGIHARREYLLKSLARVLEKYNYISSMDIGWQEDIQSMLASEPDIDTAIARIKDRLLTLHAARRHDLEFILQLWHIQYANSFVNYEATGSVCSAITLGKAMGADWTARPEDLGWGAHTERLHVIDAGGDHFSMVKRAHAKGLAQQLKLRLHQEV